MMLSCLIYTKLKYRKKNRIIYNNDALSFLGFVFLIILSYFRTCQPLVTYTTTIFRSLQLIFFIFYTHVFINYIYEKKQNYTHVVFIVSSIFIVINLFLFALNITFFNPYTNKFYIGESVMYNTFFGVNIDRVVFPLVSGFNEYGVYAGAILTFGFIYLFSGIKNIYKTITLVFIILSFVTILYTDNRGALACSLVSIITVLFLRYFRRINYLKSFVFIFPFIPYILLIVLPIIGNYQIIVDVSRSSSEVESANARQIIWAYAANELIAFKYIHLVGWGDYGQFGSGASSGWADMLDTFENSQYTSAHNFVLQMIFDIGYIGVGVFLVMFYRMINICTKIYKNNYNKSMLGYFAVLMYMLFAGSLESLYVFKAFFILMIYFFTVIFTLGNRIENQKL